MQNIMVSRIFQLKMIPLTTNLFHPEQEGKPRDREHVSLVTVKVVVYLAAYDIWKLRTISPYKIPSCNWPIELFRQVRPVKWAEIEYY